MIAKPTLTCGPRSVTLPTPSDFSLPVISGGVEAQSLNGTYLKDVPWRKYQYQLTWEAMDQSDFADIEDLVNYNNDFGVAILFQFSRFRQSDVPVYCNAQFLAEKSIGAHYVPSCYQNVVLTLTEINPREMVS